MTKVSVIIPVYNVQDYLEECIKTVLSQTLKDIEILLIDDGSTDSSGTICDEYAAAHENIKVVHQENSGQSAARNRGVSIAQGDYIAFVDSDDGIHPQMLECLSCILDKTKYKFVHCGFHRDSKISFNETDYSSNNDPCSQLIEISSDEGMIKMMDWKTYGHYIVKGLYRTSYIKNYTFKEGVIFEDIIWSAKVVGDAKHYAYVPYDFYTYRMRESSSVHDLSWSKQKMYFEAISEFVEIVKEKTPRAANQVKLLVYQAMMEKTCKYLKGNLINKEIINEIVQYTKCCELTAKSVITADIRFRRKLIYVLSLFSFPTACKVRNRLIR